MSHLSQVVQTLPSDPSLNKIGPTICGYSSGCRLWASISRSFDHRRAQSECICKCVQIRFILTYGCKWVFSLVFTATSTVWLKNLYLNMLSWYDVRFNSKLTTGHFFVDHFVNTSSEESTRVSTLELFLCIKWILKMAVSFDFVFSFAFLVLSSSTALFNNYTIGPRVDWCASRLNQELDFQQ